MPWPVTLNGRRYTLADFSGTNYVRGFPDALSDFATQASTSLSGTSTTGMLIGGGDKTLQTQPGKPWLPGAALRISAQDNPGGAFMDGWVKTYDPVSGQLTFTVTGSQASGTQHSAWNINAGGGGYAIGASLGLAQGGTGASNAADARANLGLGDAATRNIATAGGSSNAGRVPVLDGSGLLVTSMFPSGIGGGGTVDLSNAVVKNAASVITAGVSPTITPNMAGVLEVKAPDANSIPMITLRSGVNGESFGWFVEKVDGFMTALGPLKGARVDAAEGGAFFWRKPNYPTVPPLVMSAALDSRKGTFEITGSNAGWVGFYFVSVAKYLLWNRWNQGAFDDFNQTFDWQWSSGTLVDGNVPINRIPDLGNATVNAANYAWGSSGWYSNGTLDQRINQLRTDMLSVAHAVGYNGIG